MLTTGIALLWVFLAFDVAMLNKTTTSTATGLIFISIRTIPLILVTLGAFG